MAKRMDCGMRRFRKGRTLVVLDIENMRGRGLLCDVDVAFVRAQVEALFPASGHDQTVIGTGCVDTLFAVSRVWPEARAVFHGGHNGADLALLDVLDEHVAERFDHVVLCSGDGIFTEAVAGLRRQGVRVTQVAMVAGTHHALARAASDAIRIAWPSWCHDDTLAPLPRLGQAA